MYLGTCWALLRCRYFDMLSNPSSTFLPIFFFLIGAHCINIVSKQAVAATLTAVYYFSKNCNVLGNQPKC